MICGLFVQNTGVGYARTLPFQNTLSSLRQTQRPLRLSVILCGLYLPREKCHWKEGAVTIFRINTCKSISKQTTLTPFRINTYDKWGEGCAPLGASYALYQHVARSVARRSAAQRRDGRRTFSPAKTATPRHAFSFNCAKSLSLASPRASSAAPATRAPGGRSPISASASMVLPLPDSPTSPSDSAGASWNEMSFTGRIHPAAVGKSTVRLRTSSKLM
jgi:hypothetical protein